MRILGFPVSRLRVENSTCMESRSQILARIHEIRVDFPRSESELSAKLIPSGWFRVFCFRLQILHCLVFTRVEDSFVRATTNTTTPPARLPAEQLVLSAFYNFKKK